MKFFDVLKRFSKRDWWFIAIFSFVCLFIADFGVTVRGDCAYSTCSRLDSSSDSQTDYYFDGDTMGFAPTVLFAEKIIRKDTSLEFEIGSGDFAADTKNESGSYQEQLKNDQNKLPKIFFLYESFLLLSIPIWFLIALFLRLSTKHESRMVSKGADILCWVTMTILITLAFILYLGAGVGSGEVNQTIPFLSKALYIK